MVAIEQWLSGKDFARGDATAAQMVNFSYCIADEETKRAWLVDPTWSVSDLVELVRERGYELAGALLTHWHPDHAGGDLYGLSVEGASVLHHDHGTPIRVHREEIPWLEQVANLTADDVTPFGADDILELGANVRARCVHTPGHTPGSTCYLVWDERTTAEEPPVLCTGDVLFVGACGRVDLPSADPAEMYRTLHERLPKLPPETIIYPGHNYGPRPVSMLGDELATNPYMQFPSLEAWMEQMR